jgi:hypothetical protein
MAYVTHFVEFISEEGFPVAVVPSQVNYLEGTRDDDVTFIIMVGVRGLGVKGSLKDVMKKLGR